MQMRNLESFSLEKDDILCDILAFSHWFSYFSTQGNLLASNAPHIFVLWSIDVDYTNWLVTANTISIIVKAIGVWKATRINTLKENYQLIGPRLFEMEF